ncbi:MAG: hypothetical protein OHK0029_04460 [Armatimonadaceae bacterium]
MIELAKGMGQEFLRGTAIPMEVLRDWHRAITDGRYRSLLSGGTGGTVPRPKDVVEHDSAQNGTGPDTPRPAEEYPRIALFTETFDEVNGVATTYRRLLDYSEQTGRTVHIYCNGEKDSVEERGNCRVFRFAPWLPVRYYENLSFSLVPNPRIGQIFYENKYDLIHVAAPGSLGLHAMWLNVFTRLPIVGVYHTRIPEYATQLIPILGLDKMISQIPWLYVKAFYDQCSVVLATTPKMANSLKADGLVPPIQVVARGIDAEKYNPGHRTRPAGEEPPVALYVGRLSVEKNLAYLAQVATRLRNEGLSFRLVIVGDGPYRAELEKQLPWAEFRGYLRGDDLSRAFADGDFFVFPSLTDTLGNVVLEAMASGLPCLVADTQGPGELIQQGVDGFLAPQDSDFEKAFRTLAQEASLRTQMGRAARESAAQRDWSGILEDLWTIYAEQVRLKTTK